jgi:hypothetical protein
MHSDGWHLCLECHADQERQNNNWDDGSQWDRVRARQEHDAQWDKQSSGSGKPEDPGARWPACAYCFRKTLNFGTCKECDGTPCTRWCEVDGLCPEHWKKKESWQDVEPEQASGSRSKPKKKKKAAAVSTEDQLARYEAAFYRGRRAVLRNRETDEGFDTVVYKGSRGLQVGHWHNGDNVELCSYNDDTYEVRSCETYEVGFVKCHHVMFPEEWPDETAHGSRRPRPPPAPPLADPQARQRLDWWNHGEFKPKELPRVPADETTPAPKPSSARP